MVLSFLEILTSYFFRNHYLCQSHNTICCVVPNLTRYYPLAGITVNTLVREGYRLSLADPIGIYITDVSTSGWTLNGQDASQYMRLVRGTKGAFNVHSNLISYVSVGGWGASGPCPPLSLLKLVIKKMATTCGALYFMFLALP